MAEKYTEGSKLAEVLQKFKDELRGIVAERLSEEGIDLSVSETVSNRADETARFNAIRDGTAKPGTLEVQPLFPRGKKSVSLKIDILYW